MQEMPASVGQKSGQKITVDGDDIETLNGCFYLEDFLSTEGRVQEAVNSKICLKKIPGCLQLFLRERHVTMN